MKKLHAWLACAFLPSLGSVLLGQEEKPPKKPDYPPFTEVSEGFEKVVSTLDGKKSLYTIWTRDKDGQMLAELPQGYERQKHYVAMTIPTGEMFSGLQSGELYVYWRRFDKRVALIAPNLGERSTGDQESKDSVRTTHAERVLVDVPIVCMGPGGQPVIDMDEFLLGNMKVFYPWQRSGVNKNLASISKAKAFPQNVELAFEAPASSGELKTFHYSISVIPESASYKGRDADERVGYFTTTYKDLGKFRRDEVWDRKINRWQLEKADKSLRVSPPKEPIVFYLEHTVPVRYRRYVKQGILAWNEAFEKVGITDAIVVHYQDKATGAHMEKDPEDVRYNFVRWLSNDIGTAIGPSRAHPLTGQILDADIVLTDGWIRAFWYQANEYLPEIAMEGFTPETLRWLEDHPDWDPRVRLAAPEDRERILRERAVRSLVGPVAYEAAVGDAAVLSNDELVDFAAQSGSSSMLCMASVAKAESMARMGFVLDVLGLLDDDDEEEDEDDGDEGDEDAEEEGEGESEEPEDEVQKIDGIPEWFIGPSLAELVSHEVGHTLGLRHNFKSSSIYTLEEMNTPEFKGKPFAGSVMDYLPVNAVIEDGKLKGDHAMIGIGPYDMWAIEYGYTLDDPKKVLERVAEPELAYLTDEDTIGPDPLARRYDLSADPRDYSKNLMKLAHESRARILDEFVEDGESWSQARRGYEITLRTQQSAVGIMANWLGGVFVHRDRKGDPGGRKPIQVVPAAQQREALKFVVENTFFDDVYGLTPELLAHMTVDKWSDPGGMSYYWQDPSWPIHDRIAGVQASALTGIMNPTTLRRIYDNELFLPDSEDVLSLHELMETVTGAIWQEVGYKSKTGGASVRDASTATTPAAYTVRRPMISNLRRNLQREHLERLIDLALEGGDSSSSRAIALLARASLAELGQSIGETLSTGPDAYTDAHLRDAKLRIKKVMDASYSYNAKSGGGSSPIIIRFGQDAEK